MIVNGLWSYRSVARVCGMTTTVARCMQETCQLLRGRFRALATGAIAAQRLAALAAEAGQSRTEAEAERPALQFRGLVIARCQFVMRQQRLLVLPLPPVVPARVVDRPDQECLDVVRIGLAFEEGGEDVVDER